MNSCATAVLEEYPEIVFSYGFSDEYSFVFQKDSKLYQRRARTLINKRNTSFFSNNLVSTTKNFLACFVKDHVFSRESFVLKKDSQLYQRHARKPIQGAVEESMSRKPT
ncbi:tRNA(His) guanylyltransferase 1-like isoform X8 [Actinidia eriantha]|uniref:tRNA(His) guanylyltransferase 1-like isoform X8 n=1 Tax=Actinidia eriantha TaxID=165200 RepID=UPI0025873B22|nr:tRNA(His) guanylyltransferase 1-like isoform X8 [Actinidia eriantha]